MKREIEETLIRKFGDGFRLTPIEVHRFMDGDSLIQIKENIRGCDVYIVQSCNHPAENLEHMLLMIDAAVHASAASVTPVFPYFPGRQDRKDRPRVGISASLRVRLVKEALGDVPRKQVMIFEPHCDQIQMAFGSMPCDLLWGTDILLQGFRGFYKGDFSRLQPAGPDAGSIKLVRKEAEHLGLDDYAIGDKARNKNDVSKIRNIIGVVDGKVLAIRDDVVDTATSAHDMIRKGEELGAVEAHLLVAHGVLAGDAIEKLKRAQKESILKHVFITDSINNESRDLPTDLFTVVTCGNLIGQAIFQNHTNGSISEIDGMFNVRKPKK